jgi:DNA primase
MAKISPVSIKYMIHANFKSEGPLEKPDVIGALFGQTEGLLGDDLDMRELQKEGKIGRIEVQLEIVDGKTVGEIQVPTALDKSSTSLIAAALETIDRIGPTEAGIEIVKIEDVRGSKRDYIMERAKKLMENLDSKGFSEFNKDLKEDSRISKIQEYGDEKLPAGNLDGKEVIVVEGRADVINMLKNRVDNVIGMAGTKLPKEITKLGNEKELTLFVDGDRGGKLIAKNVIEHANIKYIAVAPDGKEVEELEGKEILMALRKKNTVGEYMKQERLNKKFDASEDVEDVSEFEGDVKEKARELYSTIDGSKQALLLNSEMDVIRKVSNRESTRAVENSRSKVYAVVLDGTVTQSLIKVCEKSDVKYLAAKNFGNVKDTSLSLISL